MAGINAKDRSRSPRFPSYSLSEAVSYVGRIYQGVHRSPIDAATAFKLMGFAGRSGASATALGAIRQFGLIEGSGDGTRVSQLALRILEPESEYERNQGLLEAANQPEVFRAISDRFEGRVPLMDEPIRAYLIRELGFSKRGVEECVASYRQTTDFIVGLVSAPGTDSTKAKLDPIETEGSHFSSASPAPVVGMRCYKVPLTRECDVELIFQGNVSENAVNRLIKYLEWMREGWREEEG